jgi:hypothetical protein
LPVRLAVEQYGIAAVRDNMVDDSSLSEASLSLADGAKRMLAKEGGAADAPSMPISALRC